MNVKVETLSWNDLNDALRDCNEEQAKTRAWREWNKLRYKYVSCEVEVLDESELLIRNDRILIANNTVVDTQDGEVTCVEGLTV